MGFALGLKAIRRLCEVQSALDWHRSKLSTTLFNGAEIDVFQWVDQHVRLHGELPKIPTLENQWPDIKQVETPEPTSYYLRLLENRYFYGVLSAASSTTLQALKVDQDAYHEGMQAFQQAINAITNRSTGQRSWMLGWRPGRWCFRNTIIY
jgi:hypothetical protein